MLDVRTLVFSKQTRAIPNAGLLQSDLPSQETDSSTLVNIDVNLLQHEVANDEKQKTLAPTQHIAQCSDENPVPTLHLIPINSFQVQENIKIAFKHPLKCKSSECKTPFCPEIKHHLKEFNKSKEPIFPNEKLLVTHSRLEALAENTEVQMNSHLDFVPLKFISKGGFGAVYDCVLVGKDIGVARMAVKKVIDKKSIDAINTSMGLLSELRESANIAIPLLVLQSPRVCYQVMILGEMDLRFAVKNSLSLSNNLIASWCRDILSGISSIHNKDFVHCDLKLANILIIGHKAVICDIDNVKKDGAKLDVYSKDFAAPEVKDNIARKANDIHCFGVILASLCGCDFLLSITSKEARNRQIFKEAVMERNQRLKNPSDRPLIKDLCANPLFNVEIEAVLSEINQILLKREAIENGSKDDPLKELVKQLPECFSVKQPPSVSW